jgi:quercetin dioxygenase-like cupin family protein
MPDTTVKKMPDTTVKKMPDTTVKKVSGRVSPRGEMDQTYLVSGKRVALRLWRNEKPQRKASTRRDYETVGYVLKGYAELTVEGQTVRLEPGDSWLVPAGAEHAYRIIEEFTAIEATSPPAQVHGRDA